MLKILGNQVKQSFWDFYFHFGSGEGDDTINLEDFFAAEKLAVIVKSEAAKTLKTDTNLEKFDSFQCNCKPLLKRGWHLDT